jgi:hypothetical protein
VRTPPIPFVSKVKKMDKVDGPDADKSEFKDGRQEDWIKWVMTFREIENLMPMKEPPDKTRMTLLKGLALSYFEHHLMRKLKAENAEVPNNEVIELVL